MGKTALLAEAERTARLHGMRVLTAAGRESEQDLAFAGLHQLLWPALDRLTALPARQAAALGGAFGLSADPAPADALLTGIGVLTLLAGLAEEAPLLVIVDDAQWLDQGSLDALAFAARRLESEPIAVLLGARGQLPPAGFERDFSELALQPLRTQAATRLLDAQPRPPRGRARHQVLAQAAGNPMALIEFSKAIAADPGAARRWAAEPLLPTGRITGLMAARFDELPEPTRAALLLTAVADSPELVAAALPGLAVDVLVPAEMAGLIRVEPSGPRFSHPLNRSAVYHAVSFAERAAAHLQIAAAARSQPDRHAWHLAAATLEPDEQVAALLEQSATRAQRRGGLAAAARAMERAAELSPAEQDRVRRALAAARLAMLAGEADWVRDLSAKVLTLEPDPDSRIRARLSLGWGQVWSNRHADALATLLAVAAEAPARSPAMAWEAIGLAGAVIHQTGLDAGRAQVLAALATLPPPPDDPEWPASAADEVRAWVDACIDPFSRRAEAVQFLHQVAEAVTFTDPAKVAGAAWILDETELAVRLLRRQLDGMRAPGVRARSGASLSVLEWACIDSGRWDEALAAAQEAADIAAAYKMENVAGSADLTVATVLALRGDHQQVAPLLARVEAVIDTAEYRGFAARCRHAAGLAALAQGSHGAAYAELRQQFAADGTPLHHHFSYLAIADLAAAGVRAGHGQEASAVLERALALIGPAPGPRLSQLAARARGLLAEPAGAGDQFARGLAEPAGETWPFERAQLRLDYGEWLRRQRRINDAKPVLRAALETFRRLGAAPWTQRTESELRACGVTAQAAPTVPGAFAELTGQQREIVILASRGLTNPEIADRLFLSPRTVASHLYRSYPKLGVAGRHQLRDLIQQLPGQPLTELAPARPLQALLPCPAGSPCRDGRGRLAPGRPRPAC
jgi:DNA-binding CsgD family transcriptional regulator